MLPIALTRLVDADEGYLLYAARLVAEGRHPYRDFFFPQPPLLPWTMAILVHPMGWIGGRVLVAALAALTGTLVALGVRARGARPAHEVLAAALFAGTALAFGWLPIIKTYALATPLIYGGHLVARSSRPSAPIVSGGLGALASRVDSTSSRPFPFSPGSSYASDPRSSGDS